MTTEKSSIEDLSADTLFNNKVLKSRSSQKVFLFTSLITAGLKLKNY
jgi:hypothetical protein